MIKFYLYLIISFLSLSGFSQNTFKMIFTGPGYDNGIAAFRTSDNGYLIVGNTASYGHGGMDVWVISLDSNANFQWQKTYGGSGNEEATKAIITPSDELIITGNSTSSFPSTVNIFVLRLSKTGVPLLMQNYGGQDWDFANSLTLQNDSTILICGKTFNGPHAGYYNSFVKAIDFQGDTLWTSYAGAGGEEENTDVVVGEDHKIYVVGSSLLPDFSVDTAFVKCLDSVGNMLWQSNLSGYARGQFVSMVLTNDSNITATGYLMDTTNSFRMPFLSKIQRDGNWVWFHNGAQATDALFSSIKEEPSGKLVIGGMTTAFSIGGEDMYNSTFSSDGWFFNGSVCGGFQDDFTVMNSFYESDSTYLAVGTTKSYQVPMSGILLLQMNAAMDYDTTTRMVVVSSLNHADKQPLIVDVYPNPTVDYTHLKFVSPFNETGFIRILDINGKEVLKQSFKSYSQEIKLDISQFTSGIYILNMESESYKFNTKIIKQ